MKISSVVQLSHAHSLPLKGANKVEIKRIGNTTIRIVPPKLTEEERERALEGIRRAAWAIIKERGRKRKST